MNCCMLVYPPLLGVGWPLKGKAEGSLVNHFFNRRPQWREKNLFCKFFHVQRTLRFLGEVGLFLISFHFGLKMQKNIDSQKSQISFSSCISVISF